MGSQFLLAKDQYKKCRESEKDKLIEVFKKEGYEVAGNGGAGRKDYTSGGNIKTYDLSNWLWLVAKKKEGTKTTPITVYFQSFDLDPNSKNCHVLFDRLSYSFSIEDEKYKIESEIINTDYDLPLKEADYQKLTEIIQSEIEKVKIENE